MARTRGASMTGIQDPDGELIDKEGKPIRQMPPPVHVDEPPPPPVAYAPVPPIVRYVCTQRTIRRDLDAYSLMILLFIAMGGELKIEMTPEEWQALPPDAKQHFIPLRADVAGEDVL